MIAADSVRDMIQCRRCFELCHYILQKTPQGMKARSVLKERKYRIICPIITPPDGIIFLKLCCRRRRIGWFLWFASHNRGISRVLWWHQIPQKCQILMCICRTTVLNGTGGFKRFVDFGFRLQSAISKSSRLHHYAFKMHRSVSREQDFLRPIGAYWD